MEPATETEKFKSPTFSQLMQTHRDYDRELWTNLRLLYCGGWEMLGNAQRFIERAPRERQDYYRWRLKVTSYVNFFARLVGYLTGSLFNESLAVGPAKDAKTDQAPALPDAGFYAAFFSDCDKTGTDFSQFMRLVLTDALVYGRAHVAVDLPVAPLGVQPKTMADEDALGLRRAYLYQVAGESLLDWEKNPDGRFRWCVLHTIRIRSADPVLEGTVA